MTAFIASMFAWTSEKMPIRTADGSYLNSAESAHRRSQHLRAGVRCGYDASYHVARRDAPGSGGAVGCRPGSRFGGGPRVGWIAVVGGARLQRCKELLRERVVHAEIAVGGPCRARLRTAIA